MSEDKNHIFPVFHELLQRNDKERFLKQNSCAIWMTGLSGSGKTTIAKGLEKRLFEHDYFVEVLDGDNIRAGINNNLGFTTEDRTENIRRIAEVSKLFVHCGVITINCFVSPTREMRNMAAELIGKEDFVEVFVNTPIEVCEQRDVKGLYAKARMGEIKNFTGIDAPFEVPESPALDLKTENSTVEESVNKLFDFILPRIKYSE